MNSSFSLNLEQIKFIAVTLMVLSLPFSESLKIISIYFLLLVFLIQIFKKETTIDLSALHYGFILLFFSSLLSAIFAENPVKSLKGSRDIFYYTVPFFLAQSITNEKHIKTILWSFYISTALAAIFGIYHSIASHRQLEIHALGNQNYTAMYLIIVITSMISTIIFSDRETKRSGILLSICAALLLIASVMTAMRTSFIALIMFVLILFFVNREIRLVKIIALTLPFFIIGLVFSYKPMWTKLLTTKSLISRFSIWEHAINIFIENPIIGIGLNHFIFKFPANHPIEPNNTLFDAHSIYFQTASQIGILGLFSLALIIFGFFKTWIKIQCASGFEKGVKYSALGGFLVIFLGGILDTTLHHEHAIAFTLLAGLMAGLYSKKEFSGDVPKG